MEGSSYEGFLGFSVDCVRFSLISNLMQNKTKTNAILNLKGQKIKNNLGISSKLALNRHQAREQNL